jgi:hypothetical protein
MKRINRLLAALIAVSLALAGLTWLVPRPATEKWGDLEFHFSFALVVLGMALFITAIVLFLKGLKGFKTKLKLAYAQICAGVFFIAFGVILLPMITILGLEESWFYTSRVFVLPYLASGALIYSGARTYAKLLKVDSLWTKWWFVGLIIAAGMAIAVVLPHAPTATHEIQLDVTNALVIWIALFIHAAAMVILAIKRQSSAIYSTALAWLFMALISCNISPIFTLSFTLTDTANLWVYEALTNFCVFYAGVIFVYAGHAFTRITTSDIN